MDTSIALLPNRPSDQADESIEVSSPDLSDLLVLCMYACVVLAAEEGPKHSFPSCAFRIAGMI
jgi:hypothetical protein